jgi:hypothetical protein
MYWIQINFLKKPNGPKELIVVEEDSEEEE